MPQAFHVLRCNSCKTFQVHQVKKSTKWSCKVCGDKQSIKQVYGDGTGADCRRHVQKLNMLRAAEDEQLLSEKTSRRGRLTSTEGEQPHSERTHCGGNLTTSTDVVTQYQGGSAEQTRSKWMQYVAEDNDPVKLNDLAPDDPRMTFDRRSFERSKTERKRPQADSTVRGRKRKCGSAPVDPGAFQHQRRETTPRTNNRNEEYEPTLQLGADRRISCEPRFIFTTNAQTDTQPTGSIKGFAENHKSSTKHAEVASNRAACLSESANTATGLWNAPLSGHSDSHENTKMSVSVSYVDKQKGRCDSRKCENEQSSHTSKWAQFTPSAMSGESSDSDPNEFENFTVQENSRNVPGTSSQARVIEDDSKDDPITFSRDVSHGSKQSHPNFSLGGDDKGDDDELDTMLADWSAVEPTR